ncbi:hypothetical protein RND81_13G027800 [Saponaria officinalis]|uniref:Uncharacterized protein n=1 Tax=Saponaria officinalis TaxID=3572 RepID=A0AAW1H3L1_SAPOF
MQPTNLNVFFGSNYINFLQLKYQGNQFRSPFETNPTTLLIALLCFLLYCFFYHSPRCISRISFYQSGLNRGMAMVCGSLALACLGSMLFPLSAQTTALHTSLNMTQKSEITRPNLIRPVYSWLLIE